MVAFGAEIVAAGRSRLGKPFKHHFKPVDRCEGGLVTAEGCWDSGLDDEGYDCSGLVIASICDVLGMPQDKWPRDRRHINQLLDATSADIMPEPGDIIFLRGTGQEVSKHVGIYAGEGRMIHADGRRSNLFVAETLIIGDQEIRTLNTKFGN